MSSQRTLGRYRRLYVGSGPKMSQHASGMNHGSLAFASLVWCERLRHGDWIASTFAEDLWREVLRLLHSMAAAIMMPGQEAGGTDANEDFRGHPVL